MSNFAIVIGIDAYSNKRWHLSGAVNDALQFAQWALEKGGVSRKNLRLLLSPIEPITTPLRSKKANRDNIIAAIQEFQRGAGKGGERLYFYYAGHGVAAPGATAGEIMEPVLVPSNFRSFEQDYAILLGFSEIMPSFVNAEPPEQFFFIDACRDFALENYQPGIGRSVGRWSPPRTDAGARSAQYILYATAPGQRAFEDTLGLGQGVFATTLLEGLRGAPAAVSWSQANLRYDISFSRLVSYVRSRIQQDIQDRGVKDWQRFVQLPEPQTVGGSADPILASITEISNLRLVVRVEPSKARESCSIEVTQFLPGGRAVVITAQPSPAPLPTTFELQPADYWLVAQAQQFVSAKQPCALDKESEVSFKLVPAPAVLGESEPPATVQQHGTLIVESPDPNALIEVWDAERQLQGRGAGRVHLPALSPGIYRARLVLPEGPGEERTVGVLPGANEVLIIDSPSPNIGSAQMQILSRLNITPDEKGYLYPSEHLGGVANAQLASLLGFAAYAVHQPPAGDFMRLRSFGVEPLTGVPPGESGLIVLIGASGDEPAPGIDVARFLAQGQMIARDISGKVIDRGGFAVLSGFSAAAQRQVALQPGALSLELSLPGLAPTRYAMAGLPDRVTVLVAVAEVSGEFEVQQYMLPLRLDAPRRIPGFMEYLAADSANIRRLELAQRYYANQRTALEQADIEFLLNGKWLDPLLGCLAGYSLVRAGRTDSFAGNPQPELGPEVPETSAMRNMLKFFDQLPDSHVLAGLCEPERRGEHYARALERGLPVFAEGLRSLHDWYKESGTEVPPALIEPARRLLPASPWTAWVVARPAIIIRNGRFDAPPLGWETLEQMRSQVERVCRSVGRIEFTGHPSLEWAGTGFLVAEDVIMTGRYVASSFCQQAGRTRWEIMPGITARIDYAEEVGTQEPAEFEIVGVIGVHKKLDMALLKISRTSARNQPAPEPLAIAAQGPQPLGGRNVYVVGYPAYDIRADRDLVQRVFNNIYGVKRLQPGQILAASEHDGSFRHDCFTLGGNAGSPVIDLETSQVIGLHFAGHPGEYKQGQAIALWRLTDDPLLKRAGVRFAQS